MTSYPPLPGYTDVHQPQLAPKRKVRVFTWVILVINLLFLIGVIAAVANSHKGTCNGLDTPTCNSAKDAGTAIAVIIVVVFWAAVDVILGIVWLVTRRREPAIVYVQQVAPQPPYSQAPPTPPSAQPPAAWYADPQNPAQLRWWDGQRFTEHTQPAQS
jgi:hypothetical protein